MRHLVTGVRRIAAAVIKKVTDVVCFEDFDQPFVFGSILIQALQFVATGAECTGRGVAQGRDGSIAFQAGVDQVFGQSANDAMPTGIDFGDGLWMLAGCFNQAAGAGVDDCCDAAGLGIKSISG